MSGAPKLYPEQDDRELGDLQVYRNEAADQADKTSAVQPAVARNLVDAFDELLRRYRALEKEYVSARLAIGSALGLFADEGPQPIARLVELTHGAHERFNELEEKLSETDRWYREHGLEIARQRDHIASLEAAARPVLELASVSVPKMRICDTPDNAFESMCALRALLPKEEP